MQTKDWTHLICEAAGAGCREMQFIGGEPTLHPDLPMFIRAARDNGFSRIEVFTNATRVDDDLVRCFSDFGVCVASSFYSSQPDVHERVTGGSQSWTRTVRGFQRLLAAGIPLRVGVIEMEQNAGHATEAITYLKSLGVHHVRTDRVRGVGRGQVQLTNTSASEFDELCGQCWKGKLCVTPSGLAYPCVMARRWPLGDVRLGLGGVLRSAELTQFRSSLSRFRRNPTARASFHDCNPAGCEPQDCYPTVCCSPDECNPVEGCGPNESSECGPDK